MKYVVQILKIKKNQQNLNGEENLVGQINKLNCKLNIILLEGAEKGFLL